MRWFYTDPLAAAWMAKSFGMRFTVDLPDFLDVGININNILIDFINEHKDLQYDIRPDSLHLLEPKTGDMVYLFVNDGGSHIGYWQESGPYRITGFHAIPMKGLGSHEVHRIIERNGVPFMWPEKEE